MELNFSVGTVGTIDLDTIPSELTSECGLGNRENPSEPTTPPPRRGWSQTKTWYWFYRIRVPVGPWCPRKIFPASKIMNYQPQHIQKREIVDIQTIKYKYKSKNNPWAIYLNQKMLRYKNTSIIEQSWLPITAKSAREVLIYLASSSNMFVLFVFLFYIFSLFLGLSVTISSRARSTEKRRRVKWYLLLT